MESGGALVTTRPPALCIYAEGHLSEKRLLGDITFRWSGLRPSSRRKITQIRLSPIPPDGSLTIYVQNNSPGADKEAFAQATR
jgi:hypothetical protein